MDNIYQIDPNGYQESDIQIMASGSWNHSSHVYEMTATQMQSMSPEGFATAMAEIVAQQRDLAVESYISSAYAAGVY